VDTDSLSCREYSHASLIKFFNWRWGKKAFHLCPESCDGDPEKVFGDKCRPGNTEAAECFGFNEADALVILTGLGKGAGTGLSKELATQAVMSELPTFVLAALPFPSETIDFDLGSEMRSIEALADATFYFDQESGGESFYIPPKASIGQLMRITESRIENCFHDILKCIVPTWPSKDSPPSVPDMLNSFRYSGRCGYAVGSVFASRSCGSILLSVMGRTVMDAQQMAGVTELCNGVIRLTCHPEWRDEIDSITGGLNRADDDFLSICDLAIQLDESSMYNINITVFVLGGR
jgi:hypothetical protein